MNTFKHNQKVTCTIQGVKIRDARISINEDGRVYICQNIKNGGEAEDKLGYNFSWRINSDFTGHDVDNLKPLFKNWEYLEVGDKLIDGEGRERMILAHIGLIFFVSYKNEFTKVSSFLTKEELIKEGYSIKQEQPVEEVEELTMEELCRELGREVKIKK